ncbi:MAG: hypothetical protein ACHQQS_06565 [Thermoanaerobaculales bacterium]
MPWVLDGNNLARGGDRERVRRAALALARRERVRILVFFDGSPPEGGGAVEKLGAVEVRYVPHADTAILATLGRAGRAWRLATDDRGLAARAQTSGAQVVGGAAFWQWVAREPSAGGEQRPSSPDLEQEAAFFAGPRHNVEGPQRVVRRRRHLAARRR